MKAQIFLKQHNADKYDELGPKEFSVLPRENEFISAGFDGQKKYFQVIALHHSTDPEGIEIYAVQTDPTWELKKKRGIGFGA
jgi:hypothetical protein